MTTKRIFFFDFLTAERSYFCWKMVLRKTLFFWVLRNVKMGCKKETLGSQIELFEYLKSLGVMNWTWFNIPWQIQLCLYMVHVYHSVFFTIHSRQIFNWLRNIPWTAFLWLWSFNFPLKDYYYRILMSRG